MSENASWCRRHPWLATGAVVLATAGAVVWYQDQQAQQKKKERERTERNRREAERRKQARLQQEQAKKVAQPSAGEAFVSELIGSDDESSLLAQKTAELQKKAREERLAENAKQAIADATESVVESAGNAVDAVAEVVESGVESAASVVEDVTEEALAEEKDNSDHEEPAENTEESAGDVVEEAEEEAEAEEEEAEAEEEEAEETQEADEAKETENGGDE